jgi:hypothetical protein
VSSVNPADVTAAGKPVILEEFTEETQDASSSSSTTERKPDREGLPSGYRMRADSHYVDQLTSSRRGERIAEVPAVSTPGRDRQDPRDRRADRTLAQLAEDLATIESAAALVSSDASPMGRRVSADLIKAQAWRASWIIRANTIIDGTHRGHVRMRPLGSMLDHLRDRFAAECRLTATTLQIHASEWTTPIAVDEDAFVAGVAGAIVATLGLTANAGGVTIQVTATVSGGELRSVEVTQDDVTVPAGVSSRFMDLAWADRPGGWSAGVGAWTARAVAQQLGGDAVLLAADRRGSTIRMTMRGS